MTGYYLGPPLPPKRVPLPAAFRPKTSAKIVGYAAFTLCAVLLGVVIRGMLQPQELLPEYAKTPIWGWFLPLLVIAAFGVFVISHLSVSHGSLTITDAHVESVAHFRRRRVAWPDVERVEFRSAKGGAERGIGFVVFNATGAILALLTGVGLAWRPGAHGSVPNAFRGPGPERKGLVPMGRVLGRGVVAAVQLGEAYDWTAFDALLAEARARGIRVVADGVEIFDGGAPRST